MTTKPNVSDILLGMKNLDLMRMSIDQIVDGLMGRLEKRKLLPRLDKGDAFSRMAELKKLFGDEFKLRFAAEDAPFVWEFGWDIAGQAYYIDCCENSPTARRLFHSSTKQRNERIQMENVEQVHDSLIDLVEGLIKMFPDLQADLEICMSAAYKFKTS